MSPALAAKKVAFVVGIDVYDNLAQEKRLQRAVNDARAVGKALGALGFEVTPGENLSRGEFNARWQKFLDKIGNGDVAAIYFSGHGVEIEGLNYLLPRDVPYVTFGRQEQVKRESLSVAEFLLDLRKRRPQLTLLILDACRDNPLIPPEYKSAGTPAGGLARMEASEGTFIMYSAGAGETALDRLPKNDPDAVNSVYTRTLLPLLSKPGLALPELAWQVRSGVSAIAATVPHVQRPAYYDGVIGKFCLAGCVVEPPSPPQPTLSEASREWARVDKTSIAELETFLRRHGGSSEAEYATARLDSLKRATVMATPQPTPPAPTPPAAILKNSGGDRLFVVQLSSQKTRADAVKSAAALREKYSSVLAGKPFAIHHAQVNETLEYHRVLVGPPAPRAIADAVCGSLKTAGGSCFVVEPSAPFIALAASEWQPMPEATGPPGPSSGRCDGVEILVGNERRCLKPGAGKTEHFKDCPTCPEMVAVPAGRFTMGSPKNEPERLDYEDQVAVTIAKPFAIGRFAITRGEFAAFVAATGHETDGGCHVYTGTEWKLQTDRNWRTPGFSQNDRHPVVCADWNDAKAYAAWLTSTTGKTYRLPSEAEREYVARAGTTTPFWWGSTISTSQANYKGNYTYAGGSKGEWRKATVPVDSFAANAWGLHNVHGNVWEWVEDCWNKKNAGNPGEGSARTSGDCGSRVLRGSSWLGYPQYLRSANRLGIRSDVRDFNFGFRVARTLD